MRSDGLSSPVPGSDRASRAAEGGRGFPAPAGASAGAAPVAPLDPIARARASTADAAALDRGTMPLRAGDAEALAREPGAQQRLGRLQQGLDYLDRLSDAMQQLKGGLSQSLARASTASANAVESGTPAMLQAQLDHLRQLWSQRPREAAGRVDGDLQAAPEDGSARQRFKLRGLDLAVLQQGGRETLRLQLPGQHGDDIGAALTQPGEAAVATAGNAGRPVLIAVTLDGEGTQDQLQALTRALSPAGLSVQAQGADVVFSVAESRWPALRDGMTLRGEGRRFPSGQPVRALLEPAPEALQPQRWTLQDAPGQRQALGQLLQAQPKLAQARARLNEQLEAAARPIALMAPGQAQALTGALAGALSGAEYGDVGALLPALRGMHRQRVRQLLG